VRGDGRGHAATRSASRPAPDAQKDFTVTLAYRPPYDVAGLLKFVAQRAIPGIESVNDRCLRRSVRAGLAGSAAGWVEAGFRPDAPLVRLRFSATLANASGVLVSEVRRWLDLDADPQTIDAALADLPGAPGLRLPGGLDAFELAVRAVLGQQVTVAAARTLAARVVERFGAPVATPWAEVQRLFPAPPTLAQVPLEHIAELGIIRSRAGAIVALAQAWPVLCPQWRTRAEPAALIEQLCALPGIGPWTAHYIVMRALGWPDAFPPNDVAVLKAMKSFFSTGSQREAEARAVAWQPWRAYAVLRLWNSLEKTP
jgi:AraC family transcriptional regulator, regulatory protein of adaptative response / DNA-3-methyladenine glycosylase II